MSDATDRARCRRRLGGVEASGASAVELLSRHLADYALGIGAFDLVIFATFATFVIGARDALAVAVWVAVVVNMVLGRRPAAREPVPRATLLRRSARQGRATSATDARPAGAPRAGAASSGPRA